MLLHGFGAGGDDLVGLAPALSGERPVHFVFPAAPLSPPDMAAWGGRAWWPLRLAELMPQLASGQVEALTGVVPDGLVEAREALRRCVAAVREDVPSGRIVLGGFSQGAMLAADAAVRSTVPADALLLMSGAPLASDDWSELPPLGVPAVVSHGTIDEVLPFRCGELLRDRLAQSQGCDVSFVPFDAGHTIPEPAVAEARRLIGRVLS